jgi:hypothetical protein
MGKPQRLPHVTCDVVEGLPGSGKSFYGVGKVLEWIEADRRPVYTNLPLRFRVFQRFLRHRGGEKLAGLLVELTQDHFAAFLERNWKRMEFRTLVKTRYRERLKAGRRGRGAVFMESRFQRLWERLNGRDILRGPGANWIPPLAVICIDEAHLWYPGVAVERKREESPALLKYLSMHRHHGHALTWITQDRMQLTATVRRLTAHYWQVRDRGEDRVAWGIRLRHFGVRAFGYVKRTPEQEAGRSGENFKAAEDYTVFPWLPKERWKFRLYDSYTNVGGRGHLVRLLRKAREDSGITEPERGRVIVTPTSDGGWRISRYGMERWDMGKVTRVAWWLASRSAAAVLFLGVGAAIGAGYIGPMKAAEGVELVEAEWKAKLDAAKPTVSSRLSGESKAAKPPATWWEGRKLGSLSKSGVSVDGKRVSIGGTLEGGAELVSVSVRHRRAVWLVDGMLWSWTAGKDPARIGTPAQVLERFRGPGTGNSGGDGGLDGSLALPGSAQPGAVEAPEGLAPG